MKLNFSISYAYLFPHEETLITSKVHLMEKPGGPPAARCPCPDDMGRCGQGELSGVWYFHRQSWPDQHSLLDRPTPTQGKKRNSVISNNNNKHT
jgi:hypothetical protein